MAAYTKCTAGVEVMMEAVNAQTDTWKVALTNADPTAKTSFVAGTDDLATGGGYTAGGNAATVASATQTGGVYKLVLNSPTGWTASGSVGPFRYAVLWDATVAAPVGFWDYGSSITLSAGDTFAVTLDGVNGVFTVS